ncbi:hypothetical protein [Aliikangiella maris]|uniref:Uncharacterized protein n=2 Tax=Aliikangiella maris TaxID=3162458 RepID=A0ABV2BPF2_9GAMM
MIETLLVFWISLFGGAEPASLEKVTKDTEEVIPYGNGGGACPGGVCKQKE